MKKLLTAVFTMLLAAGLAFAQDTGGSTDNKTQPTTKTTTGKKGAKTKAHKGGKKSKKGSGTSNPTPPPK
jgi:hypothetical protein